jgi:hypothetical protein
VKKHILILVISSFLLPYMYAQITIKKENNELILDNEKIRIIYNLKDGTYDVFNNKTSEKVIENAYSEIKTRHNFIKSDFDNYRHSYTEAIVEDELGEGKSISIVSERDSFPTIILQINLYKNKPYAVFQSGVVNKTGYSLRFTAFQPLAGVAFKDKNVSALKILDGNGGGEKTAVRDTSQFQSRNNILVTFLSENQRNTIIAGGITYTDFEKFASIHKRKDGLHLKIWEEDPVGKLVDPDQKYMPEDKFYLDFCSQCPFESAELYGKTIKKAQKIDLSIYDFPTLCLWYSGHEKYGNGEKNNTSVGAVKEMEYANQSGFTKYSRLAVRLVPDKYDKNNQQGWWDDEHWQKYENDACCANGGYEKPYETTKKWAQAVTNLGGIPLMYFQTATRSEDYCLSHPEHMLFNDPMRGYNFSNLHPWQLDKSYCSYDFTDSSFIEHMHNVYQNLEDAGVKGLMYDYPKTGWAKFGGMEDKYSTTAAAYRKIFSIPHNILGDENYLHERNIGRGSEITLGLVASQRTMGDTDKLTPGTISISGLRWYKNRVVVSYDGDAKNLKDTYPDNRDGRRAMLTMSYVAAGRLLFANSFSTLSDEELFDFSRAFPYHTTPKSARPIDAFTGVEYPKVYDFVVNPKWHQLTLFNTALKNGRWQKNWHEIHNDAYKIEQASSTIAVKLSSPNVDGGLGLDENKAYYLYDFWNNHYIGKLSGADSLLQTLRPGEARMISVHELENHPQFISTNRHIMQGYIDIVDYPVWNNATKELTGTSKVVQNETYIIVLAKNDNSPVSCKVNQGNCKIKEIDENLFELHIDSDKNTAIKWTIKFE